MMLIQTIKFLWPFLKEMILGDKTLKEALRHHFGRVLVIVAIILSIVLNFFTIPKLLTLSYEHVELKRKHAALLRQHYPNAEIEQPPPHLPSEALPVDPAASERYRQSKEFFDRLKAKENHR